LHVVHGSAFGLVVAGVSAVSAFVIAALLACLLRMLIMMSTDDQQLVGQ
jgi:hypothetical protein